DECEEDEFAHACSTGGGPGVLGASLDAKCGEGRREAELDSTRGAEMECGFRSSIRCEVRRGKADSGARFDAKCGEGRREAELDSVRGAAPHSAFLPRTPPWVEPRIPPSSSALKRNLTGRYHARDAILKAG